MNFQSGRKRFGLAGALLLGVLASLVMAPRLAAAELQKVEAVGSFGIREGTRSKVIPRDQAVQNAIWEGVSRVALQEIGAQSESGSALPLSESPETDAEEISILKAALGSDMLPYTRRFRIVQDKGENPVLFAEDPRVLVEYVVVVEMLIDVDRVKAALSRARLIAVADGKSNAEPIYVELVDVGRYQDFDAIRSALVAEIGASRVEQLGFARGQQLLSVEGPFGPRELSSALARLAGGGWSLEPIGIDNERRRIRLRGHREEPVAPD